MTSNAYIASDGKQVMKVGKANDVRRREKQIGVPVTLTVACLDEAAAFRVESQLRDFVIEQRGIRHQGTIDWFRFDARIYTMLCEFAVNLDGEPVVVEEDLDQEIARLSARYHRLLFEEYQAKVLAAEAEAKRLRSELDRERSEGERLRRENREAALARIEGLLQELAVLKYRLGQLEKDDDE